MVGVERDDPAVRNARTGPRWKSNEVGHLRGGANDPAALDRWRRCEAAFALGRFAAWCVIDRARLREAISVLFQRLRCRTLPSMPPTFLDCS